MGSIVICIVLYMRLAKNGFYSERHTRSSQLNNGLSFFTVYHLYFYIPLFVLGCVDSDNLSSEITVTVQVMVENCFANSHFSFQVHCVFCCMRLKYLIWDIFKKQFVMRINLKLNI